ncbi:MAG: hypothetical protein ACK4E7_16445 [Permianibacter sp.]
MMELASSSMTCACCAPMAMDISTSIASPNAGLLVAVVPSIVMVLAVLVKKVALFTLKSANLDQFVPVGFVQIMFGKNGQGFIWLRD